MKPLFDANEAEEYFLMQCTYWRNEANRIFQRDNAKRDSNNFVYSAEYQMAQGKHRALEGVCNYFRNFELPKQEVEE